MLAQTHPHAGFICNTDLIWELFCQRWKRGLRKWNHTKTLLVCIWISGNVFLGVWATLSLGYIGGMMKYERWYVEMLNWQSFNKPFSLPLSVKFTFHWDIVDASLKIVAYIFGNTEAKTVAGYSSNGGCAALKFPNEFLVFYSALQVQPHWRAGDGNSRGGKLLPCCWWSGSLKVSAIWEEFTDKVITAFSALCPPTLPFRWLGVGMHHSTSVLNLCSCG